MTKMTFRFNGKPKPVQSFRFAVRGKFAAKYQPKSVTGWKKGIAIQAREQLPTGFEPFKGAVRVKIEFVFAVPKSYAKKFHQEVDDGVVRYRIKKPDLTDNLPKGLIDALSGVIWESDQQICKVESRKVYGLVPHTMLEVEEISQTAETATQEQPGLFSELSGISQSSINSEGIDNG